MNAALVVPFPPSVNGLFAGRSRRYRSRAYKRWHDEAVYALAQQQPLPRVRGAYRLSLSFGRPDRRRRDLGNLEKPVSDLLVSMGIVEDDALAEEIRLRWDGEVTGCLIEISQA